MEWSLEALYKGYDDPQFDHDFEVLDKQIKQCHTLAAKLSHDEEVAWLVAILEQLEAYTLISSKLGTYISLRQSVDTTDSKTVSLTNQLDQKKSGLAKTQAIFRRYIADVQDLEGCIEKSDFLQNYAYLLKNIKEEGIYMLQEDVEEVLSKMDISGGSAWSSLQEYLTSTVEVNDQGEKTTLSQIRNRAYDKNPAVRKNAYIAEMASYDQIKDALAFSLNNIKKQGSMECELRGFSTPLAMSLHQAHMKSETLDAMMAEIIAYLPKFHTYLKRKAKILGYTHGLPWYELFAPLGEKDKKYTIEEAKAYLLLHFGPFAEDMATMIDTAFHDKWIDFYPHKGKVGGAFCCNIPFLKQSRILTNYDGSLGDIVTLAHELGHAYHGMMIEDHRILNCDYSMPLAETASTFNENIIMNAAIEQAEGQDRIALIDKQLQDLTQIICDIYSRFLFEQEIFDKSRTGFLFANELEELMLEAQRKAYGDGLDAHFLHSYMWINKSHYYASDLSFYNYPYAFGGLFARGLFVQYTEEGSSFITKYRKLLHATTIASVEEVAQMADIDITDRAFWKNALDTCAQRIDEFLYLTK